MSALPIAVSARTIVEGSFDETGVADLAAVYDVGLALGVPEQTVRLAIRRMAAAGELVQEGRGRAGRIIRSSDALRRSRSESRLIDFAFAQDAGAHPWDGNWRLYAFSVPESARPERDALRAGLTAFGAAPIASGLYGTPHDLREGLLDYLPPGVVDRWLISAATPALVLPGRHSTTAIVELLWPAGETLAAYEPLANVLAGTEIPRTSDPVAVTAAALLLAEGLDRALSVDPLLPGELRPSDWPPATLRARFLHSWEQLRALGPTLPVFA